MTPKELVQEWVRRFNEADIDGLASLYAENATNRQVVMAPLRGCGFFRVLRDQIVFQRGYFDQLSFFRLQGLAVPENYLAG